MSPAYDCYVHYQKAVDDFVKANPPWSLRTGFKIRFNGYILVTICVDTINIKEVPIPPEAEETKYQLLNRADDLFEEAANHMHIPHNSLMCLTKTVISFLFDDIVVSQWR